MSRPAAITGLRLSLFTRGTERRRVSPTSRRKLLPSSRDNRRFLTSDSIEMVARPVVMNANWIFDERVPAKLSKKPGTYGAKAFASRATISREGS